MTKRYPLFVACAILMIILLSMLPASAAGTDRISFMSTRDSSWTIYAMNADGTGQAPLTSGPDRDFDPAWSADGSRIAFTSDRDSDAFEIYAMFADGTGLTRLTANADWEGMAAWSPDGSRIAFASGRDGDNDIYVMNSDGTGQTSLISDDGWGSEIDPAWSPDGSRIAFTSDRDGNAEVYVMNADGSGQGRLTENEWWDGTPAWSPDGSRIAFTSDRDGDNEIYVMNVDGTGQTRLTADPASDTAPAWSPDSTRIAFESDRGGNIDIYVIGANGAGQQQLTSDVGSDRTPAWVGVADAEPASPTAGFSFAPAVPAAQRTVTFSDGSSDSDGTIVGWSWDFGDDGSSAEQNPGHAYTAPGSYVVTLAVTDDDGLTDSQTSTITIGAAIVRTPGEAIADLVATLEGLEVPARIEKGLTDKLDSAVAALNAGNERVAVNNLNAFIKQARAQRGKALAAEDSSALIAEAQSIIRTIRP